MIDELEAHWGVHYSEGPPIAHWLRTDYEQRWVRFHSMPGSKRWPEDAAEMDVILGRHNAVLAALANEGEPLWLLTVGYSENGVPIRAMEYPEDVSSELVEGFEEIDPDAVLWRTLAIHEIEDDPDLSLYWHVYASRRVWSPRSLDRVLRHVARDEIANVMIVSEAGRWLYHPYDGGADVILESTRQRDMWKAHFSKWLSAREDGM